MSRKEETSHRRNVLFLCSGNSSRSIMAEAILNRIGAPRFHAFSAGSHPKGHVHPEALLLLEKNGYDLTGLRSKSWDEFACGMAIDHIATVCNKAAAETCPVIPGRPAKLHWDIPDPASRTPVEMKAAFRQAYDMLLERIEKFVRQ